MKMRRSIILKRFDGATPRPVHDVISLIGLVLDRSRINVDAAIVGNIFQLRPEP